MGRWTVVCLEAADMVDYLCNVVIYSSVTEEYFSPGIPAAATRTETVKWLG